MTVPLATPFAASASAPAAPHAPKQSRPATLHGVTIDDPYAWLRSERWQTVMRDPAALEPGIRAHLDAENAYTAAALADTEALQARLFAEMKARIKEDDASVPTPDGAWDYYSRYVTGGQYPLMCRRPRGAEAGEQVLIDGNAEAAGKAYWQLGGVSHSPDHRLVAYSVDDAGSEFYTIRLRDTWSGYDLADRITDAGGSAWSRDGETLFYVRHDDNHRPRWVYRHRLGTPASDDVLVYEEPDPGFFVGVGTTQSHAFVVIDTHRHDTSEIHVIDASDPESAPRLVVPREYGHECELEHLGDQFLMLTNSGGAEDFRICAAPIATPDRDHWREIVPHKPGCLILSMGVLSGHLARLERENGLPRIIVREHASGAEHAIAFDEEAYSLGLSTGYEFDTTAIRFTYSSMTTPSETWDYDMATRARVLRKRQEVPSGHDPHAYVTRRLMAPAPDGETVPVSILYRRDTPLDGSAPLLLYGYGAYGIAIPAAFSTTRLSLVDRGFVYAIAHIRGGKEKGYRWYTEGKRAKKPNTFSDFIAAGEHLVAQGFTRRGQIVGHGGSAGGMLMGAVANMAPDLFLGLVANVPFVDVLNTMLDKDLPLTPPEWPEWGNPLESAEDFATIRAYSPYDNVRPQAYPHIFALAGLTDPRVTYWEPAKWVARLRELNTGGNMILLKTNMDAGHGGASGRFEALKETATEYAFALKIAGKAAVGA